MTIIETIKIKLEAINKGFNSQMKQSAERMKKFNEEIYRGALDNTKFASAKKKTRIQQNALIDSMKGGLGVFELSQERWKEVNKQGYRFTRMSGRAANGVRKMTHGMRGFRMEMLGVMFFGMSLTRLMGGLMGKSLEWTGVMEVLSAALGILFLPIAMQLLDWALLFLDWVNNLSEEQKKLIGVVVLLVGAFGIFLTILGTLALGIGSLIQVFTGWTTIKIIVLSVVKFIAAAFAGLTAPILIVIAIITAIIIGMVIAWKENFLNMKQIVDWFISGFMDIFGGLITFFKGLFQIIYGIFTGDWKKIWEGVTNIFTGILQVIWGIVKVLINGIAAILIGIIRIAWSVIKLFLAPFIWLGTKIGENAKGWVADLLNAIKFIPNKIMGFFKRLPDFFANLVPDWLRKLVTGGGSIFSKLKGNIGSVFGFAEGGVVPGPRGAPMPAIVHGGERIIPPGKAGGTGSINQTITINAQVSNDYDVRKLADQLNRYWVSDINKMTKSK